MKRASKSKRAVSAESIAKQAERGKDISMYFTNKGKIMPAIQRVEIDFTEPIIDELDEAARELNLSQQAVIKTLVRQALDQHTWLERPVDGLTERVTGHQTSNFKQMAKLFFLCL